jgi:hypothetical protein
LHLLKAIKALSLQAGVMAEGVAEAVATEQRDVTVKLLASLPTNHLPPDVQVQLQELNVQYDESAARAAEDFDIPEISAEELLQLGDYNKSNSSSSRDLLQLASYLANAEDLSCVLEHRDGIAEGSLGVGDQERRGSALLSKARPLGDGFGDSGEGAIYAAKLLLDQDIELSAADLEDDSGLPGGEAEAPSGSGAGAAGTWSGGMAGGIRTGAALKLPADGLKVGKVSLLGQLKSKQRNSRLPPSSKPLSSNAQVKPSLEVMKLLLSNSWIFGF